MSTKIEKLAKAAHAAIDELAAAVAAPAAEPAPKKRARDEEAEEPTPAPRKGRARPEADEEPEADEAPAPRKGRARPDPDDEAEEPAPKPKAKGPNVEAVRSALLEVIEQHGNDRVSKILKRFDSKDGEPCAVVSDLQAEDFAEVIEIAKKAVAKD